MVAKCKTISKRMSLCASVPNAETTSTRVDLKVQENDGNR